MKEKDFVKFKNPLDQDEKDALMVIIEMRDDRALVSDLRFSNWSIPPTDVYSINDLELVSDSEKISALEFADGKIRDE